MVLIIFFNLDKEELFKKKIGKVKVREYYTKGGKHLSNPLKITDTFTNKIMNYPTGRAFCDEFEIKGYNLSKYILFKTMPTIDETGIAYINTSHKGQHSFIWGKNIVRVENIIVDTNQTKPIESNSNRTFETNVLATLSFFEEVKKSSTDKP